MLWRYVGSQPTGQKVKGKLMANSEAEARKRLSDMGINCSSVECADDIRGSPEHSPADQESKNSKWWGQFTGASGNSGSSGASAQPERPDVPPSPESEKRVMESIEGLAGTRRVANQMGQAKVAPKELPSRRRRETILVNDVGSIAAQAEPFLAELNGRVRHALMGHDPKGWLKVMLVIEHDCEGGG